MLEEIEEVVKRDLTVDLPELSSYWEAIAIVVENGVYKIVEEWNRWKATRVIPAHKAILYTTTEEVLSTISNSKLYVRGKAVLTKGEVYFKIDIDRTQIKDLEAELLFLLGESL